jgi:hypothetical protein
MDARLIRTELGDEDDVLFAIADRLTDEMDDELSDEAAILAEATPGQRAVYLLFTAGAEIAGSGLRGYLESESGRAVAETAAAADEVGAAEHVAILRELEGVFPGGGVPVDDDARADALDLLGDDALTELDLLEARWEEREDELRGLLEARVEATPGEFFQDSAG